VPHSPLIGMAHALTPMPTSALPFHLSRSSQVIAAQEYRQITERIDGLLRLEGDRLVVQWRAARQTQRYGAVTRADQELDPVREISLALGAIAGAEVRAGFGSWFSRPRIVLTASDLWAFDEVAGATGLRLDHPATLVFAIRRGDRLLAREFTADLNLAVAERAVRSAESPAPLPPPGSRGPVA